LESRDLPLQRGHLDVVALLARLHFDVGCGLAGALVEAPALRTERHGRRGDSAAGLARDCAGHFKRAIRLGGRIIAVRPGDRDTRLVVELACSVLCSILGPLGDRRNARRMRRRRRALHRSRGAWTSPSG
jgi:hypothetical protein